jgi:integrative and conjugative element protein (TIGR02256 family)
MIDDYEAWSEDAKYGLRIPSKMIEKMLKFCRETKGIETGGIMVGYYNVKRDCAIVIDCSGPPNDSKRSKNYFHRGIYGLQKWIDKLWELRQRRYYIGEWHFHPFSDPDPSGVDVSQIKENAENNLYQCPEPIMFILGGSPSKNWTCKSFVYVRNVGLTELIKSFGN